MLSMVLYNFIAYFTKEKYPVGEVIYTKWDLV